MLAQLFRMPIKYRQKLEEQRGCGIECKPTTARYWEDGVCVFERHFIVMWQQWKCIKNDALKSLKHIWVLVTWPFCSKNARYIYFVTKFGIEPSLHSVVHNCMPLYYMSRIRKIVLKVVVPGHVYECMVCISWHTMVIHYLGKMIKPHHSVFRNIIQNQAKLWMIIEQQARNTIRGNPGIVR